MTVNAAGHNYMSNSEIMLWMQDKTSQLYGTMNDEMTGANGRGELSEDLKNLKAELTQMKTEHKWGERGDKIDAFLAKHANDPDLKDEDRKMLQDASKQLHTAEAFAKARDAHPQGSQEYNATNELVDQVKPSDDTVAGWIDKLSARIDDLGQTDQRGLLVIGDLNSQINQTRQLASNLISAANQSSTQIISNTKA